MIERLVVLVSRNLVLPEDLPSVMTALEREPGIGTWGAGEAWPAGAGTPGAGRGVAGTRLRDLERHAILEALERAGGVQVRAAELLGITPRQIRYRLRKFGIVRRYDPVG